VLADVSFRVAASETLSVLGPSGSGKTTLLRALCGLEPIEGRVRWDGRDLAGIPVHERRFGLVFQDYLLFPHLDVAGNVAFGLRMQRLSVDRIRDRVSEVLGLVGLEGREHRRVTELSGGEQQRVALARALAPAPRLLMLDEPLGALDRSLRERLAEDLRTLARRLDLAQIHVTHDQEEAFAIGDRIAILDAGRLVALGTPEQLWSRPPSAWVARFLGFHNVAEGVLLDGMVETPWGDLPAGPQTGTRAGPVDVIVPPDGLVPVPDGDIRGVVVRSEFRGDQRRVTVRTERGGTLQLAVSWSVMPTVGTVLNVSVLPGRLVVMPREPDIR
jgi:thiamine transport system ATP-binding protein